MTHNYTHKKKTLENYTYQASSLGYLMPKTPLELAKFLSHIPRRPFLQYAPAHWNTAHHRVTFLKNTLKSLNKNMTKNKY